MRHYGWCLSPLTFSSALAMGNGARPWASNRGSCRAAGGLGNALVELERFDGHLGALRVVSGGAPDALGRGRDRRRRERPRHGDRRAPGPRLRVRWHCVADF